MFFQYLTYYIENMASRSPKTWCITYFHVLIRMPPSLALHLLSKHFQIRPQKCRKPVKILKIRYKSVITKNPLYLKNLKSIFNRLGVFRSVCNLYQHLRMIASSYTCCLISVILQYTYTTSLIRYISLISVITCSGQKLRGGMSPCTHYVSINLYQNLYIIIFPYLLRFKVIRSKYRQKRSKKAKNIIANNISDFFN